MDDERARGPSVFLRLPAPLHHPPHTCSDDTSPSSPPSSVATPSACLTPQRATRRRSSRRAAAPSLPRPSDPPSPPPPPRSPRCSRWTALPACAFAGRGGATSSWLGLSRRRLRRRLPPQPRGAPLAVSRPARHAARTLGSWSGRGGGQRTRNRADRARRAAAQPRRRRLALAARESVRRVLGLLCGLPAASRRPPASAARLFALLRCDRR